MKKIVEAWLDGVSYLFTDDLTSFYTFFTVIFAECAYLWSFQKMDVAIPLTVILLAYIFNVVVFAKLKGNWEGTRNERLFAIIYAIMFLVLFVTGCIIDLTLHFIMTVILLAITGLSIAIRNIQSCGGFKSMFMLMVSQIMVIAGPFIIFVVCLAYIPMFPIALKVIIPVVYLICIPFIVFYEDDTAACNIFELAYDITWNEQLENYRKKIEDSEENKN